MQRLLVIDDELNLLCLLNWISLPALKGSRRSWNRDHNIAWHHAYLKSLGEKSPTAKVAMRWDVARSMVKAAVVAFPYRFFASTLSGMENPSLETNLEQWISENRLQSAKRTKPLKT